MSTVPHGPQLPQPTRYVYEMCFHDLVRGKQNLTIPNHWNDFLHTVVPISYCEYVLVDKGWVEETRQVQNALRRAGLLTHEAQIFGPDRFNDFLTAIRALPH